MAWRTWWTSRPSPQANSDFHPAPLASSSSRPCVGDLRTTKKRVHIQNMYPLSTLRGSFVCQPWIVAVAVSLKKAIEHPIRTASPLFGTEGCRFEPCRALQHDGLQRPKNPGTAANVTGDCRRGGRCLFAGEARPVVVSALQVHTTGRDSHSVQSVLERGTGLPAQLQSRTLQRGGPAALRRPSLGAFQVDGESHRRFVTCEKNNKTILQTRNKTGYKS